VASAIAGLPERLQMVIQLYFVEELNLAEIADVLSVSVPRVHQLKRRRSTSCAARWEKSSIFFEVLHALSKRFNRSLKGEARHENR